ncbi:MAG: thioredoxin domain-containing protein [Burkholderiales bacterium]|nr:thioredoxin domain-containing protein [Burkholderiales bacterium]
MAQHPNAPPEGAGRNRLAHETSPYLQQHADNPVDWHPWGEAALALARDQDKPILLSIGYSACHWCHVMAHESFEDPDVARVMNEHFVNIKVDREERPDIDQIYQTAHQLFNQRGGGWPLTAFLTPDQTPFFVGTYFPKEARYHLPGFVEVLGRVAAVYREHRGELEEQGKAVRSAFARMEPSPSPGDGAVSAAPLAEAVRALLASFDARDGGFGAAPKFPHPTDLELLLREWARTGEDAVRHAAVFTLERMAEGGIYDHLGGGFCRYSVDAKWAIPHFEKMLYDNGPLLRLYANAWTVTREVRFAAVVEETAGWLMRELQSPEGGFYSSLDADSEGHEGKFYVWTPREVKRLLGADEFAVAAPYYGLDGPPNFEGERWNLVVACGIGAAAQRLGRSVEECERLLASARRKLLAARGERVRPGRDEKLLTSWNALAIQAMARAAAVFGREEWLASARRALDFVRAKLWNGERLLATYKDGHAHLNAYVDDYAFLIAALLELAQADFRPEDLRFATRLADVLLVRFEDSANGVFSSPATTTRH